MKDNKPFLDDESDDHEPSTPVFNDSPYTPKHSINKKSRLTKDTKKQRLFTNSF